MEEDLDVLQGYIPYMKQYLIIGAVVALFALIYFGIAGTGSIMKIELQENGYKTEPIQTGTFILNGIEGTYETVWLGDLTSYSGSGGRITTDYTILINGDNDGDFKISNNLIDGSTLILTSSNQLIGSDNGGTNYIEAKVLLPAGKITANYEYSLTSYYGDGTSVLIKVDDKTEKFATPHYRVAERGGSKTGNGNYEIILTESKEVTFRIETTTSQTNELASGKITVKFEPTTFQEQHDVTPNTNDHQIKHVQLNFIDRINAWIQNFFNKIFGGSK